MLLFDVYLWLEICPFFRFGKSQASQGEETRRQALAPWNLWIADLIS